MPNLRTLADLGRGESHDLIEGLLRKGQSIILCGSDLAATSLLALQLALDIAGGEEFLGKYPTTKGEVLFLDANEERLERDRKTLNKKITAEKGVKVPSLRLGQGLGEGNIVATVSTERPALTIINQFPGSGAYVEWLDKAKSGSVIAIFENGFNGNLSYAQSVWVLDAKPDAYTLQLRTHGIALELAKTESGFELLGEAPLVPGQRPVFKRAKMFGGQFMRDKFGNIVLEEVAA